jgi:uncharacterized membrane protein YsdA (DUF1294 family)
MDLALIAAAVYVILNLIAFAAYFHDKRSAWKKRARTSERRLLLLALLGPFGAYAAMRLFRHKTRHRKFLLVPLFMLIHLALIVFIVYREYLGPA